MIKYNYEVSVNENRAKLNKDIFLFRGNRNIHYYFSIKGARFAFSKENEDLLESSNAIYAAVTVVKPNGVEVANAIAPVEDGLIHLKVTEDLIDEEVEVGDFDLVFDLFDDNEGAVTIPKIKGQFHVQERPCTTSIGTLSGNVNVVNQAVVDLAIATQENEQLIVVDDDGKYVKTTWVKGDKISIERLNKIEEGIEKNNTQIKDIKSTQIILEKDDTSMNGIDDTTHDTLTTTDKTIIGGINEVNSQCKDIAKKTITTEERTKLSNLENYDDTNIKASINNKADKNAVFSMANMGQDIKEAMTGGSVAVVGKNTVLTENIADKQVTPKKTSFLAKSKNLFNKNNENIQYNKILTTTGGLYASNDYYTSDYIEVDAGKKIVSSYDGVAHNCQMIVAYDSNKTKLEASKTWISEFTTPSNTKYIRFAADTGHLEKFQIEYDNITPFKNYEIYSLLNNIELEDNSVATNNLVDKSITMQKLDDEVNSLLTSANVIINLQDAYIATPGIEFNIYWRNVILTDAINEYFIACEMTPRSTAFYPYNERLAFKPLESDIGEKTISIKIYKNNFNNFKQNPVAEKTIKIKVVENKTLTTSKNAIFIGDSLTDYNVFQKEVKNMFGDNFNLLGTRGTAPYNHEGRSGWTAQDYFKESRDGVENAFYNPTTNTFDFSYYMNTNYPSSTIDVVNIFLGTNNGYSSGIIENQLMQMVNSIHNYNPNIVVTIMTAHLPAYTNDGYATVSHSSGKFILETFSINFTKKLYEVFSSINNVYIIPSHINLDTINDYATVEKNVSDRNNVVKVKRYIDNVHPWNPYGFYKFADVWYTYYQYIMTII